MDKILDEVTVTLFSNVLNKKIQEIKIKVRKFEKEKKRKERVGRVSRCLSRIDGRLAAADRV